MTKIHLFRNCFFSCIPSPQTAMIGFSQRIHAFVKPSKVNSTILFCNFGDYIDSVVFRESLQLMSEEFHLDCGVVNWRLKWYFS